MIQLMRKGHKWLLTGIIILLGVSFIFYFSNTDVGTAMSGQHLGEIYGRPVSQVEFQRSARMFNLARELGMFTLLQDMVSGARTENEAYTEFTWNLLVLQREAERLGIRPTPQEVANVVRNLRPFRGQTDFDPKKYDDFTTNVLPSLGFNEAQIEELAANQLALQRIKELVGSGVHMPEAETRENYERAYGKLHVSAVRLRSEEIAKDVQVTEEEIAKYYEAHKSELKSEEKRTIGVVNFAMDEEQKKLAGRERTEVLQKLADRATDFSQALLDKGGAFDQVAGQFQMPVQVTGSFTRLAPDPLLKTDPQLASAAFKLSPDSPTTDPLQVTDGFYILHLNGIEAAQPLTLDQARQKIVDTLKKQKERELVSARANEVKQKMTEALKPGVPADVALQQAGVAAEKLAPFALADPPMPRSEPGKEPQPEAPDLQMIKSSVAELNPGEVSDVVPTEAGAVIAVLENRESPAPAIYEAGKQMFQSRYLQAKQEVAFYEWLRERRREAGVQMNSAALEDAVG